MKLKARRQKDVADVVELMKSGIDLDVCRRYLVEHAAPLVLAFETAVANAATEE